jgi:putative alpha-1,2-mannosidase
VSGAVSETFPLLLISGALKLYEVALLNLPQSEDWSSPLLLAEALGHAEDAAKFKARGQSYRALWNPETRYFQPRDKAGKFSQPFDPHKLTYLDKEGTYTKDYCEGSALQWRWGAGHDGPGMVALFPSAEALASELDAFFRGSNPGVGQAYPGPITGTATSRTSTRRTCSTTRAGRT